MAPGIAPHWFPSGRPAVGTCAVGIPPSRAFAQGRGGGQLWFTTLGMNFEGRGLLLAANVPGAFN